MKKNTFILITIFLFTSLTAFTQRDRRGYVSERFRVELDGAGKTGYIKPVVVKDTLVYTVRKISDTLIVRKRYDSLQRLDGKRYFIRYKYLKTK